MIVTADDIALTVLRKLDTEDARKAFKLFKRRFLASIDEAIATVYKWLEHAGASKYGNKIKGVLASADENLNKAVDFVKKQIDGAQIRQQRRKNRIYL